MAIPTDVVQYQLTDVVVLKCPSRSHDQSVIEKNE